MGLDSVELLMEWEKAFAIEIPDKEAEQIVSVNDATATILRHIQLQPAQECKSQQLFYQFRRYFSDAHGTDKNQFHPATKLKEFIPFEYRKKHWQVMQHGLGWQLPELVSADVDEEPKPDRRFIGITWVRRKPAITENTVQDFIGFVFALNYQKLIMLPSPASRYEVEKVVMGITSDRLGIPIEEIKPESLFTNDLGID